VGSPGIIAQPADEPAAIGLKKGKKNMLKLAACSAAALLYIATIPQALAWEANPEPGYCAQFFTNIDCNTIGPEPPNSRAVEEQAEPEQVAPVPPPKPEKKKKRAAAAPQHAKQSPDGGKPAVSR
jgi:hypothetical protein